LNYIYRRFKISKKIKIRIDDHYFEADLQIELAPKTSKAFLDILPFKNKLIHARWSGEATWIPMGDYDLGVSPENTTSHPSKGEILFYPNGKSETEILVVYGSAIFSSKVGLLAGNHFLTIKNTDNLAAIGNDILWNGAKEIEFNLD